MTIIDGTLKTLSHMGIMNGSCERYNGSSILSLTRLLGYCCTSSLHSVARLNLNTTVALKGFKKMSACLMFAIAKETMVRSFSSSE